MKKWLHDHIKQNDALNYIDYDIDPDSIVDNNSYLLPQVTTLEIKNKISEIISSNLTNREEKTIYMRFNLDYTYKKIWKKLNLSESEARTTLNNAFKKIVYSLKTDINELFESLEVNEYREYSSEHISKNYEIEYAKLSKAIYLQNTMKINEILNSVRICWLYDNKKILNELLSRIFVRAYDYDKYLFYLRELFNEIKHPVFDFESVEFRDWIYKHYGKDIWKKILKDKASLGDIE